jgi:hypothetical protein
MFGKNLVVTCIAAMLAGSLHGQAKKPSIMVVPADVWCNKNSYMMEFDNQGTKKLVPDYRKALQSDSDLKMAISKIGELMAQRGFPLVDLEAQLKKLESQSAEDNMSVGKGGEEIAESPVDKLKKVAKADIIMSMDYTVSSGMRGKQVTFNLQGLDAYTAKQVAAASGTGVPAATALPVELLVEAVIAHIDNFNAQLQTHFDDLFTNGREVALRIRVFSGGDFDGDLESEYDGEELGVQIENWVSANTVQGRFGAPDATENMMRFEQVRIPLYDATNKALDTRSWARVLQKHLKDAYGITAKLGTNGLGEAIITIGGK